MSPPTRPATRTTAPTAVVTALTALAILAPAVTGCVVQRAHPTPPSAQPETLDRTQPTGSAGTDGAGGPPRSIPPRYRHLLPPRTRDIDLSDLDPCAALTTAQLRDLRYDLGYARPPRPDHSDIHGGPDCTFSSTGGAGGIDRNIRVLLGISTTEGAEAWLADPTRPPHDPRPVTITPDTRGPFHGVALLHPKLSDDCLLVIDTAAGQYLEIAASAAISADEGPDRYCAEAAEVARLALTNAIADHPEWEGR